MQEFKAHFAGRGSNPTRNIPQTATHHDFLRHQSANRYSTTRRNQILNRDEAELALTINAHERKQKHNKLLMKNAVLIPSLHNQRKAEIEELVKRGRNRFEQKKMKELQALMKKQESQGRL